MANATKESIGRRGTKRFLKFLSSACVEAAVAGGGALALAGVANPVVGGMIIIGSAIATAAACSRVIDPYVEEQIDQIFDAAREAKEASKACVQDIQLAQEAKKIKKEKGLKEAAEFLKENGFTAEQTKEILK